MATQLLLNERRGVVSRTKYTGCKGLYNNQKQSRPQVHDLPKIGSIIIINERHVCRKRPYLDNIQIHGYRGCVYVTSESTNLITGKEYYNQEISHTISFRKQDFQCGLLQFIVVEQPIYKVNHSWYDYAIEQVLNFTM